LNREILTLAELTCGHPGTDKKNGDGHAVLSEKMEDCIVVCSGCELCNHPDFVLWGALRHDNVSGRQKGCFDMSYPALSLVLGMALPPFPFRSLIFNHSQADAAIRLTQCFVARASSGLELKTYSSLQIFQPFSRHRPASRQFKSDYGDDDMMILCF
jgi:hypothetical protein